MNPGKPMDVNEQHILHVARMAKAAKQSSSAHRHRATRSRTRRSKPSESPTSFTNAPRPSTLVPLVLDLPPEFPLET